MATSGTFVSPGYGKYSNVFLRLHWQRIEVDTAGNRSKIRLTLSLQHTGTGLYFSTSKTGTLHGQSFTYTGGFSGTGTKTLRTRDVWVAHNSDGTKTQNFSASFNINISFSGSYMGTLSVSGNAVIDSIPRASSFSISGNTLGSPITVTINRASSSFTHQVVYDLPDGSRRSDWSGIGTSHTFTPSISDAQYITNSTSGTAKIVVRTYQGSNYIGYTYKTFKMNVPSSVKPSATGLNVSIAGSGRDKAINKYVQSISKVTASFTGSTMYGATITSSHITVKRSNGGNSQTIRGTNGTTANAVSSSGTYIVEGYVRDSRGRTATVSTTITVEAYTVPRVSKFTTARTTPSSSINAAITASWSPLGTSNPTNVTITSLGSAGNKETIYTLSNNTEGVLNTTQTFTNQSDSESFEYEIVVTDSFGKSATAKSTVGTAFIELTISKGKGVGIGKVHEEGSLDVAGAAFFSGQVYLRPPVNQNYNYPRFQMHSADSNGHSYLEWFGSDGERKAYFGIPTSTADHVRISNTINPRDGYIILGDQRLSLREATAYYNGKPAFTSSIDRLWEGSWFMQDTQTVTPSVPISHCPNGWVLVWSAYSSGAAQNASWDFTYIPRAWVESVNSGGGIELSMMEGGTTLRKYIYARDTFIQGHATNRETPNNRKVLRYVFAY